MRIRKEFLFVALLSVSLLLTGCVYIRLLELKLQLNDFEKNFALDTKDGLSLSFKNPMLLDDDIAQFFKWVPSSRQHVGTAEKWHFAWVKEPAKDDPNPMRLEVGIDLFFTEHKLVRIYAPENFFAMAMPKTLAIGALHALGHAKVDKEKREADSTIDSKTLETAAADRYLTKGGLGEALGRPTSSSTESGLEVWHYTFAPAAKGQTFSNSGMVYVNFSFDASTGKVRVMRGQTPFGGLNFDTTQVGPGKTGSMNSRLGD